MDEPQVAPQASSESVETTDKQPSKSKWTLAELCIIFMLCYFFSIRLRSVPLLILALWFKQANGNRWVSNICWGMFFLSLLSPFDIAFPQLSSDHRGTAAPFHRRIPIQMQPTDIAPKFRTPTHQVQHPNADPAFLLLGAVAQDKQPSPSHQFRPH
jgi:hypothetical protein